MGSEVGLQVSRQPDETWRQAVERIASREGLQVECLGDFDILVGDGISEPEAAFAALSEWDCCDLYVSPSPTGAKDNG